MGKLNIVDHPLILDKIAMLRDEETGGKEFRELVQEIAMLICYDATRNLPTVDAEVQTPVAKTTVKVLENKKFAIVPILRAGIGMVDGMLKLMPTAKVGHIGLYRDPETLLPVEYYCKLPTDIAERDVYIVDPMLATGGTAEAAISFLKERNVKNIKFLCLLSAPEGVEKVLTAHPDVEIFTASHDTKLNEKGYIVPGLGDAGDRIFGTK